MPFNGTLKYYINWGQFQMHNHLALEVGFDYIINPSAMFNHQVQPSFLPSSLFTLDDNPHHHYCLVNGCPLSLLPFAPLLTTTTHYHRSWKLGESLTVDYCCSRHILASSDTLELVLPWALRNINQHHPLISYSSLHYPHQPYHHAMSSLSLSRIVLLVLLGMNMWVRKHASTTPVCPLTSCISL